MKIKVIGIGNRIMKDDSIGIRIAEALEGELKELGVEVIIGETDIEYTLNAINADDYIIILDSSILDLNPGEISIFDIKQLKEFSHKGYSMHQMSLVKILSCFPFMQVEGILITVEAADIDFGTELSEELTQRFKEIKDRVFEKIKLQVKGGM
ncbi:hydrogenase maturation protease [Clostridium tunisiense]|uniref:hydrogenase maturation protease n=1 Tax=Clostridium tunisiense TaxID=219748 RepID=UPI0002D8DF43|nr:hydrogenase maturation protease [Clostridium tunisiense]